MSPRNSATDSPALHSFMHTLLCNFEGSSVTVEHDNARVPADSSFLQFGQQQQQHQGSSSQHQRLCRWGNASPSSLPTNSAEIISDISSSQQLSPVAIKQQYSRWGEGEGSPSRWNDVSSQDFSSVASPAQPFRQKEGVSDPYPRASRRNPLPQTLRNLPY
jgi:hypothetical protein